MTLQHAPTWPDSGESFDRNNSKYYEDMPLTHLGTTIKVNTKNQSRAPNTTNIAKKQNGYNTLVWYTYTAH